LGVKRIGLIRAAYTVGAVVPAGLGTTMGDAADEEEEEEEEEDDAAPAHPP
jgi:hypothetical protein